MAIGAQGSGFAFGNAFQAMHILGISFEDILVTLRAGSVGDRPDNFRGTHRMWIVAVRAHRCLLAAFRYQSSMNTVFIFSEFFLVTSTARLPHTEGEIALAVDGCLGLAVGFGVQVGVTIFTTGTVMHRLGVGLGRDLQRK